MESWEALHCHCSHFSKESFLHEKLSILCWSRRRKSTSLVWLLAYLQLGLITYALLLSGWTQIRKCICSLWRKAFKNRWWAIVVRSGLTLTLYPDFDTATHSRGPPRMYNNIYRGDWTCCTHIPPLSPSHCITRTPLTIVYLSIAKASTWIHSTGNHVQRGCGTQSPRRLRGESDNYTVARLLHFIHD